MSDKDVLQLAQELTDKKEWADVYKICNESELENIIGDEAEQIALLKINSIINCIPLNDIYKDFTEDEEFIYNEEYENIVDLLFDEITGLIMFLISKDTEVIKHKFERFVDQISNFVKELYLSQLDISVNTIFETPEEETKYINGYRCLGWLVLKYLLLMATPLDIEDCEINTHLDEVTRARQDKLYERAGVLIKYINEQTTEFPYFSDGKDIAIKYLRVQYLIRESLPEMSEENKKIRIERLKMLINVDCDLLNAINVYLGERYSILIDKNQREEVFKEIEDCTKEIQVYENDYVCPKVNKEFFTTVPEKSGGCYVATAVYGSYDCPEVWTLRRYRDYTLAETWHGRAFIRTYYAISPTLVKWFGHTEWFKKMWQGKLDRMVAKLQANGIESTPYEDKEWK